MRQETRNIYQFNELSEPAKQKAIESFYDVNLYDCWYEFTIEYYEEELTNMGFIDPKINFSGFSSQGDGASFTCSIDVELFLKNIAGFNLLKWAIHRELIDFNITIYQSNMHYYHEYSTSISMDYDIDEYDLKSKHLIKFIEYHIENLEQLIGDKKLELSQKIYQSLQNEYYDRTSEPEVTESIIANDYEFLENGDQL